MELHEIADRLEINELLARYCHALDRKDWPAFRACFAGDAQLDFTAFGGPRGDVATLETFLIPVLNGLASAQHMVASVTIDLEGDSAKVRSAGLVPMTAHTPDGGLHTVFNGLWYEDECVRTPAGWKFRARVQVRAWIHNAP